MIKGAEYIISELSKKGYQGYMVGGCVRDTIMGKIPYDYDIATDALPDDIIEIFDKTFVTGKKHGTVTVLSHGFSYEVTTFRIDGDYINNRKPESVTFTKNIEEDLKRRDFTINAIAYNKDCGYIDYFEGMEDIKRKIIRTVLEPSERFTEDALRILRGLRFSVKLNFEIEEKTFNAMKNLSYIIKNISAERINVELGKMFEINPYKAVKLLNEINFFSLYGITVTNKKLQAIKKLENKNLINTISILIYDMPDYNGFLSRMKFSNKEKYEVKTIILALSFNFFDKISIKKFLKNNNAEDFFCDIINICEILGKNMKEVRRFYSEILTNKECYRIKDLKINGNDLIKLGYKNEDIGKALNYMLDLVICDNSLNEYEKLINIIH